MVQPSQAAESGRKRGGKVNSLNQKISLHSTDFKLLRQIKVNTINNYNFFKVCNICWGRHCHCLPQASKPSYTTYVTKTFYCSQSLSCPFFVICFFVCNCEAEHSVCESLSLLSHPYCRIMNETSIMMKLWFCVEVDVCLMLHVEAGIY